MEYFQAGILECVAISSSRGSSWSKDQNMPLASTDASCSLYLFALFCLFSFFTFHIWVNHTLFIELTFHLPLRYIHTVVNGKIWFSFVVVMAEQQNISSGQSLSRVWHFVTPWTAALQASLSIINSWSLLKLMSIELVMPSNHLILCCPLLLLPSIFPSIRSFPRSHLFASGGQSLVIQLQQQPFQWIAKTDFL